MSTVVRAANLNANVTGTDVGGKKALDVNVTNSLSTTPGPVQFVLDGTDTEVELDTGTPANSKPLPVTILDSSGDPASFASETTLDAIKTAVEILDNVVSGSEAQVDVVSSALPTGAATEAKQDTGNTALAAIQTAVEVIDNAISGSEMQVDVVTLPSLPAGTSNIGDVDVASLPGTVESDITAIKTAVEILDNTVSGSEMQVDVVTLPGTVASDITAIKTAVEILDNVVSGSEAQVDVVTLPVNAAGDFAQATDLGTTAATITKPANAVGFVLMASSSNTVNLRWCIGTTATTSAGMILEPGRDTGYIPCSANISIISESGTNQEYDIQWVLSS